MQWDDARFALDTPPFVREESVLTHLTWDLLKVHLTIRLRAVDCIFIKCIPRHFGDGVEKLNPMRLGQFSTRKFLEQSRVKCSCECHQYQSLWFLDFISRCFERLMYVGWKSWVRWLVKPIACCLLSINQRDSCCLFHQSTWFCRGVLEYKIQAAEPNKGHWKTVLPTSSKQWSNSPK